MTEAKSLNKTLVTNPSGKYDNMTKGWENIKSVFPKLSNEIKN